MPCDIGINIFRTGADLRDSFKIHEISTAAAMACFFRVFACVGLSSQSGSRVLLKVMWSIQERLELY
jgi:hypothetical protein